MNNNNHAHLISLRPRLMTAIITILISSPITITSRLHIIILIVLIMRSHHAFTLFHTNVLLPTSFHLLDNQPISHPHFISLYDRRNLTGPIIKDCRFSFPFSFPLHKPPTFSARLLFFPSSSSPPVPETPRHHNQIAPSYNFKSDEELRLWSDGVREFSNLAAMPVRSNSESNCAQVHISSQHPFISGYSTKKKGKRTENKTKAWAN
jgi:hypothetical protein